MKNVLLGLSVLLILLLSGCASNTTPDYLTYKLPPPDTRDIKTLTVEDLCRIRAINWGERYEAKIYKSTPEQRNILKQQLVDTDAELKRRKAFTKREWHLIKKETIAVGMSKNALLCSMGFPQTINSSSYGPDQYVYEHLELYVYVSGNRVTAWN